jgi:hypothetical protein
MLQHKWEGFNPFPWLEGKLVENEERVRHCDYCNQDHPLTDEWWVEGPSGAMCREQLNEIHERWKRRKNKTLIPEQQMRNRRKLGLR